MKKEKSCGAIVYRLLDEGYEFLVLKHCAGHYAFPKGHVEAGESEEETAIREIKEEASIDVVLDDKFRYMVTYSPKKGVIKDVVYFMAKWVSGVERPQESEIQALKWVRSEDVLDILTFDNDKELFKKGLDYLK